jgi:hypothetical protein
MREVAEHCSGSGRSLRSRGLTAEVLVVIVEVLQGSTSYRGAAGGRACGHLGSMRDGGGLAAGDGSPRSGDVRGTVSEPY